MYERTGALPWGRLQSLPFMTHFANRTRALVFIAAFNSYDRSFKSILDAYWGSRKSLAIFHLNALQKIENIDSKYKPSFAIYVVLS